MRYKYFVYAVRVDGDLKLVKSDNKQVPYSRIIKSFKDKGYNKVWVENVITQYYNSLY